MLITIVRWMINHAKLGLGSPAHVPHFSRTSPAFLPLHTTGMNSEYLVYAYCIKHVTIRYKC